MERNKKKESSYDINYQADLEQIIAQRTCDLKEANAQLVKEILERKKTEEALLESNFALDRAQQIANIGSWKWDIDRDKMLWSNECYRIFGLTPQETEMNFKKMLDFVHCQDHSFVDARIKEWVKAKQQDSFQYRITRLDGSVRFIHLEGEIPFGSSGESGVMFAIIQDITERRKLELNAARAFNFSVDMLCIVGFDGYLKQVNPAWENTLGWPSKELLTKPFIEFIHPDDRQKTIDAVKRLSGGEVITSFDNRYLCKDGSYKWIAWSSFPLLDEECIFGVARDITLQKKNEDELKDFAQKIKISNDELEQKVKERTIDLLRANQIKSDFLANASHELRTPLNSIIGFSEILYDQTFGALNEKQKEYISDVLISGKFLLSLVNEILDLSKIESGKESLSLSVFSLGNLLEENIAVMKELANRRKLKLFLDLAQDLGQIKADQRKVRQVVYNLLSNAVKFTPEGGSITLKAFRQRENVEVEVWDTGIGIPDEYKEKIFEEFFRIDSVYNRNSEGTGLGLVLAKKLVKLSGGRIWVESEGLNKGSVFKFVLPVSYDEG